MACSSGSAAGGAESLASTSFYPSTSDSEDQQQESDVAYPAKKRKISGRFKRSWKVPYISSR